MAELLEERSNLDTTTVGIYRTAAVVKGGRRFSFSALVVIGDRRGNVGIGYAKAPGVPAAIEKAQKAARKNMFQVPLQESTIPHAVMGKFGASSVKLIPAAPGTGVIAGGTVRAVLELAGIRDCLTKAYGSTNQKNLCKAALNGLQQLRRKETVVALRGVDIPTTVVEEVLEVGRRYMPKPSDAPRTKGPENLVGKRKPRGRGRGEGGPERRGRPRRAAALEAAGEAGAEEATGGAAQQQAMEPGTEAKGEAQA